MRTTRTELDKIIMVGMSKIDQLVNKLCDDCVTPQIEVEQPEAPCRIMTLEEMREARFRQATMMSERAWGMQNAYNPFDAQRAAGQANLGMLGSVF